MVMVTDTNVWTPERVLALPEDGNRYEVIDGELLVTPTPRYDHQLAAVALFRVLDPYVTEHLLGTLLNVGGDIQLDETSLVQPDLFLMPPGPRPRSWKDVRVLRLAIEILSRGTARTDRTIKRLCYQRNAVPEYWIVDLDARLVERWRPGDERPEILSDRMLWHPEPSIEPLVVDLAGFFKAALEV
ncbi:MAG: Uma2 family endonuclease [Gemmatimonadaceae bacterium]|nr:Uma2 family endonuclease [Gemmatimonadaceae bacterium]MDQ3517876.1 Uma2 family endonuclease [Gemmatimonadota bacterium]